MDQKKLTVEVLRSIPFPKSNTSDKTPTVFDYKTIGLNDLIVKEEKEGQVLRPLTGNKDLLLILTFIGLILVLLVLTLTVGMSIYNEIQELKRRLPKDF
ncbi:MAG: hypothetical protein ACRCXZ_07405 [Patescibacteria group bacterium]